MYNNVKNFILDGVKEFVRHHIHKVTTDSEGFSVFTILGHPTFGVQGVSPVFFVREMKKARLVSEVHRVIREMRTLQYIPGGEALAESILSAVRDLTDFGEGAEGKARSIEFAREAAGTALWDMVCGKNRSVHTYHSAVHLGSGLPLKVMYGQSLEVCIMAGEEVLKKFQGPMVGDRAMKDSPVSGLHELTNTFAEDLMKVRDGKLSDQQRKELGDRIMVALKKTSPDCQALIRRMSAAHMSGAPLADAPSMSGTKQ